MPPSSNFVDWSQHTHSAFFYGTLMAPSVLKRVTGHDPSSATHPLRIRPAILPGFRRHRVHGVDYPAILPASAASGTGDANPAGVAGSGVRGTYVEGLADADMWRLDVFEGPEYERRDVRVRVLPPNSNAGSDAAVAAAAAAAAAPPQQQQDEMRDAQTYVWIAPREELEDGEWDFDEFVREKLWRWAGRDGAGDGVERSGAGAAGGVDGEDGGFADVERAVRERREQEEADGRVKKDPTGGRSVDGGSFERAVNGAL